MEDRVEANCALAPSELLRATVQARDPGRIVPQQLRREVAQGTDNAWLDQLDLAVQVLVAVLDLDRHGISVAGRPALEYVGDEHIRALQADLFEQGLQEFARASHER